MSTIWMVTLLSQENGRRPPAVLFFGGGDIVDHQVGVWCRHNCTFSCAVLNSLL
jgi:hypothetical protein